MGIVAYTHCQEDIWTKSIIKTGDIYDLYKLEQV